MKCKSLVLVLALALAPGLAACRAPATVTTPAGKAAYSADQIVIRVGEFQDAVIAANKSGHLPDAVAIPVVQFCVDAAKTLKAAPAGWQATLATGWRNLRRDVPALGQPPLASYALILDGVLAAEGLVP